MGLFSGVSLRYPLGRNSSISNAVTSVTKRALNPVQAINKATGLKLPDKIKIGGTSIGLDPLKQAKATLKDLQKAGKQANKDWQNAGRGEIGKWAAGYGQSVYNIAAAPVNVISGKSSFEKESQKTWGGFHNLAGMGTSAYFGQSSGVQKFLRDENLAKNTLGLSKNYAGTTRGSYTMNTLGTISNEDRVQAQQLGVKVAAVLAAIFGGAALAGGGGAGAAGGGGSAAAGAGTAGSSSLTLPALGSSAGYGTTATYGLGAAGTSAAAGGAGTAAAAGGTAWYTAGLTGLATGVGSSLLKQGQQAVVDYATEGIGGGNDGGFFDDISDFITGGDDDSGGSFVDAYPTPMASEASLLPQGDQAKVILWSGVLLLSAVYIWRRSHG